MVSLKTLNAAYDLHRAELKQLDLMTDNQYKCFYRNFTIGQIDPDLSRGQVKNILLSMIAVNRELYRKFRNSPEVSST